ncbi:TPA: CBS domain-containing protein [Candidatus Woesearchaeota archaeon]|nr:Transcriptional regulator, XRE family [archaeon GW2011_AR15]MBS3104395.1 CBS domain-containing protein [Candidatus Woesearchaeota archaeon]HIH41293.1 CBS domain-containing protein [Candidatus Woesearchaeota archaeon]
MEDISEIKRMRKKIGLTQSELAYKSGVSQSLIAKIESGKIDPSYTNAKKIFETLRGMDKGSGLTAKDIMYRKIISAKESDTIKDTILKMRQKNISQMPVVKQNKVVGYISESLLLDKVIEGKSLSLVREVMKGNPPVMPPYTSQEVIGNLLKDFPLVLIEERGELLGVITKADLLKVLYSS